MALEAISGTVYHDAVKSATKQRTEASAQTGASNITITEAPDVIKTTTGTQAGSGQGQSQNQNPATEDQIKEAVKQVNTKLKAHRTRCEFSYHEETNRVSIKVFDRDTEKLIREIPPEETLEMVEKIWEIAGILIDEKR